MRRSCFTEGSVLSPFSTTTATSSCSPAARGAVQSGSSAWTPRLWARPRALHTSPVGVAGHRLPAALEPHKNHGRHIDPERGQDQRSQREGDLPALPGLIRRQPSHPSKHIPTEAATRYVSAMRGAGQPSGGCARGTRPGLRDRHPLARARSHLITLRHVRARVIATQALPIVDVVGERLVPPGRVPDLVPCTVDVHLLLG